MIAILHASNLNNFYAASWVCADSFVGLGERLRVVGEGEYEAMAARVRGVAADVVAGNRLGRFLWAA